VSAIIESVAVMLADEQGSVFPILLLLFSIFLPRCQPSMRISHRSFDFDRERQQLCQRVQFIYLHSSLSFLVPSSPRSLSIAGPNADGIRILEASTGGVGTVGDTGPTFSSTSQDESTSEQEPESFKILPMGQRYRLCYLHLRQQRRSQP